MSESISNSLMHTTQRPPVVMARGAGSYLWDETGQRYLDFIQGWAVNCLGHAPELVRRALTEQASRLLTPSPALHNRPQLALVEHLSRASGLDRVWICSTGAEANEGAIKLARKWGRLHRGGAHRIITTHGAFHGRTLATMAASGKPGWDALFPPAVEGFIRVPFGDLDAIADAIDEHTVAVMAEPIQGEGGVVVPPDGHLRALRALCGERGILWIADEVQTGIGRTGLAFGHQHEGVTPDIMTLGKGLGAGVPIAALLASEAVACFAPGDQGGTYAGNPLMCAVAMAVCEHVLEPQFLARVRDRAAYIDRALEHLARRGLVRGHRGRGLLWALILNDESANAVQARAFEAGLIVNAPRPNLLRLMPALTVTESEIDEMIEGLTRALTPARTEPG